MDEKKRMIIIQDAHTASDYSVTKITIWASMLTAYNITEESYISAALTV